MNSPLNSDVYAVRMDGKDLTNITPNQGNNRVQFSSTYDYFVWTHNTINSPSEYSVHKNNGDLVRTIEENKNLKFINQTLQEDMLKNDSKKEI